ncbi:hypothetical protein QN277_016166 [Acacia crassicarpa]|uniref:Uncharacterized protein n=1 Tax=Acacia crassicarpa TaxID=499986 RepID=A0AAE1TB56_9FABA|nr:hypothetical protein QN277_016166 [Acacia crassicarpa]
MPRRVWREKAIERSSPWGEKDKKPWIWAFGFDLCCDSSAAAQTTSFALSSSEKDLKMGAWKDNAKKKEADTQTPQES